jgi:hypothetical protein
MSAGSTIPPISGSCWRRRWSAQRSFQTSGIALRRADARLFLISLAFLSAAGFLALHALATPGVLLDTPNQGFVLATPVGLLIRRCSPASRPCACRPSAPRR